jgi:tight adherence protein B
MPIYATYLFYGAIFLSVLLLVEGLYFLVSGRGAAAATSPNRRLRMLAQGGKRDDVMVRLQRERPMPGRQRGWDPIERFGLLVAQAGVHRSPRQMAIVMAVFTVVAATLAAFITRSALTAAGAAVVAGCVLPMLFLMLARKIRYGKMMRQLPDAIDIVVRSLRAGHPVPTAIGMVAREMPDPVGTEFGLVVDEMTYGLNLDDAMANLAARVGIDDLHFMVVAVMIQGQVGGNLAEVLESISRVIRERAKMRAKIRALSAEGRFSAVLLSILPFALMSFILLLRPEYYRAVVDDPVFYPILSVGLVLMVIGIVTMYRMVNFRV